MSRATDRFVENKVIGAMTAAEARFSPREQVSCWRKTLMLVTAFAVRFGGVQPDDARRIVEAAIEGGQAPDQRFEGAVILPFEH